MVTQKQSCDIKKSLPEYIKTLEDFRKDKGKRHELYVVIIIAIMAIMNNHLKFRAFEDYAENHKEEFHDIFKLKKKRLPKRDTFRRVFKQIDFEKLNEIFEKWVLQELKISKKEWISFDGKSIKNSLPNEAHKFVTLVSFFAQKSKKIILQGKVNSKSNEIPLVQSLINHFEGKDSILIGDALHTQKKTINKILNSGNSYVLCAKANQKNLLRKIKFLADNMSEIDKYIRVEKNRGRIESREIHIYENDFHKDLEELGFKEVNRIIKVKRTVFSKKKMKLSHEIKYYISNKKLSAKEFAIGIRNHWLVESMHWIKDSVMCEDKACIDDENTTSVFSILRGLAINLIRDLGYEGITQGMRLLMGNIKKMWIFMGGDI